ASVAMIDLPMTTTVGRWFTIEMVLRTMLSVPLMLLSIHAPKSSVQHLCWLALTILLHLEIPIFIMAIRLYRDHALEKLRITLMFVPLCPLPLMWEVPPRHLSRRLLL
ncbi:hypothetical protein AMTR_s00197p00025800, partial [Amborella trichopoda]